MDAFQRQSLTESAVGGKLLQLLHDLAEPRGLTAASCHHLRKWMHGIGVEQRRTRSPSSRST